MQPKVYIVLVNYNGYKDTLECVKSLKRCVYQNYEIVVVENGSSDSCLIRQDAYLNENTILLFADTNLGFSAGNNIGISYARRNGADYILLLNNDTVVETGLVDELVAVAEANQSVAVVTSFINYYHDRSMSWYSGGRYSRLTGITSMHHIVETKISDYYTVSFSTGCLMLIRGSFVDLHGGLDERFFMYSEDTEYGLRVQKAGLVVACVPKVLVYHKVNASVGKNSILQQYYSLRNNLYIAKEYSYFPTLAYIVRLFMSLYEIIRYGYSPKVAIKAIKDFGKGIIGKTALN